MQPTELDASEDVFIWGNNTGINGDDLEASDSYIDNHSCVNKISSFFVGSSPMLYSRLKPKVLNILRDGCYKVLNDMPTSNIYDTLPGGRSEFLHQAIKGGYIDNTTVEVIHMFIRESILNYILENRDMYSNETDTINQQDVYDLLSVSINLTRMHDYHRTHDHRCDLSGAIYLDVDTDVINTDNNPQGCIEWFTNSSTYLRHTSPFAYATFQPKSGDCCLWSGIVPHHVYPTFKPTDRLMLTYNANFIIDDDAIIGEAQTK
jgi:hypothetical protein